MKFFNALTRRQVIVAWVVGAFLTVGLWLGAYGIARQVVLASGGQVARLALLSNARADEVDSLARQYAAAHPDDATAQRAVREYRAQAESIAGHTATLQELVARGVLDTSFAASQMTTRRELVTPVRITLALVLQLVALIVPIGLLILTILRLFHKRREDTIAYPA